MSPIALNALSAVETFLSDHGSNLKGDHREAIKALLSSLMDGIEGKLDPVFYLASIDTGVGKTLTVSKFLQALLAAEDNPSSSVLICLSRLDEIQTYMELSGLDRHEVAVLTSDKSWNALGVNSADHDSARVMFTTQQMIVSRTKGRSFAEATEFHYQGRPRSLKVWDESILPAEPITLPMDDIAGLVGPVRYHSADYANQLWELMALTAPSAAERSVTVPEALAELKAARGKLTLSSELRKIVEGLRGLAGREVLKVNTFGGAIHLAGVGPAIPVDFAPCIILDASGRVRASYDIWERERGTLRRLTSAVNRYDRLAVHLWERPCGRQALASAGDRAVIAQGIAEAIREDKGSGGWLIVHYTERGDLFEDVVALVDKPGKDVRSLTWGMHHGTNAFADLPNIVLVGQLNYGPAAYPAIYGAASGRSVVESDASAEDAILMGEYQHHLLQAVCRSSARRSHNGFAGNARAYIIATPAQNATSRIEATFPGCTVTPWAPGGMLPEKVGMAAEFIRSRLETTKRVTKTSVREHLGMTTGPNFNRDIIKNAWIQDFLGRHGIHERYHHFERGTSFKPYPGGGWTLDEHEDL